MKNLIASILALALATSSLATIAHARGTKATSNTQGQYGSRDDTIAQNFK